MRERKIFGVRKDDVDMGNGSEYAEWEVPGVIVGRFRRLVVLVKVTNCRVREVWLSNCSRRHVCMFCDVPSYLETEIRISSNPNKKFPEPVVRVIKPNGFEVKVFIKVRKLSFAGIL